MQRCGPIPNATWRLALRSSLSVPGSSKSSGSRFAAAQEIITEGRPKDSTFATLAVLAYQAGQTRKGDLATQRALDLADKDDRNTLKSELEAAKQQAVTSQLQDATQAPTGPMTIVRRRDGRIVGVATAAYVPAPPAP